MSFDTLKHLDRTALRLDLVSVNLFPNRVSSLRLRNCRSLLFVSCSACQLGARAMTTPASMLMGVVDNNKDQIIVISML